MFSHRRRSPAATVVVAVVTATAVIAGTGPASAAGWHAAHKPKLWSPFALPATSSVRVKAVATGSRLARRTVARYTPPTVSWPTASDTTVTIGAAVSPHGLAGSFSVHAPGTPITVVLGHDPRLATVASRAGRAAAAAVGADAQQRRLRVHVASRGAAQALGVDGLVVSVAQLPGAGSAGAVAVHLDYAGFAGAFGAGYAGALRLVEMPACALTTPTVAACRVQTPLAATSNNLADSTLAGAVTLPPTPASRTGTKPSVVSQTVLAAAAGTTSGGGDYTATSLAPSEAWSGGGSTGAFTYDYPITTPASVGGDAPTVNLTYNSASVDGRTSATNNQASWVGDGWDYSPGFIERSYESCAEEGQPASGDNCWAGDNATLSLNGSTTRLVPTGTNNVWRLQDDDGSSVSLVSGAANGLNAGTYWRVTTQDGTQYFFGADHLPGSVGGTGADASTNAAWGAPVFEGNVSGDPCTGTFDASQCTQGWRWNLDFVVDPHSNIIVYRYTPETNYYSAGLSHTLTKYVRGGVLASINYSQNVTDYAAGTNPGSQILFGTAPRCNASTRAGCTTAFTPSASASFPDVPAYEYCASTGACSNGSPSFWSTLALSTITTKVYDTAYNPPVYNTVDTYTLGTAAAKGATPNFPDPGDTNGTGGKATPALWLTGIQHTGNDTQGGGSAVSLSPVTFNGAAALPNRVAGLGAPNGVPPINRYRLINITTETGEVIGITYDTSTACERTSPPAEASNTTRCFPVRWTPPTGYTTPILDWFLTYPVLRVSEGDNTTVWSGGTNSPGHVTTYAYAGAAWHRDDSEFTPSAQRSYSDFRGYHTVTTTTGATPDPITQTVAHYLQGMGGTVTDAAGDTLTDTDALAGFPYQTDTDAQSGGAADVVTVQHPWMSNATATESRSGLPDLTSNLIDTDRTDTRQLLADGTWRVARTATTFDTSTGLPTSVDDLGQITSSGTPVGGTTPQRCTTTSYATDPARNMLDYPDQTITNQGACTAAVGSSTIRAARTYYDRSSTLGALPGPGNPTASTTLKTSNPIGWTATATTAFDSYGRSLSTTDPLGRKTTLSYGTGTAGKYSPIAVTTTNPAGWTAATSVDPDRGLPVSSTDVNSHVTSIAYDGLGRHTQVWLPDHTKASYPSTPSLKYAYTLTATGYITATTQTLLYLSTYSSDVTIYDSLLQLRQTQTAPLNGAAGARLIATTVYDSHGWVAHSDQAYYNSQAAPSTTPVTSVTSVPGQTFNSYDGRGRPLTASFYANGTYQWKTSTGYPGEDETDTTPPAGGTPTTTLVDARGQQTQLRQYHSGTASGAYDVTYHYYDAAGQNTKLVGPLAQLTDPATSANTWRTSYDDLGNIVSADDPDTGTTTSSYDDDSQLTSVTDAADTTLGYTYDTLGRKTSETTGAGVGVKVAAWTYDPTGAKGQAASSTRYASNGTTPTYSDVTAGYTAAYKPTGDTITIPAGAYGNTAAITYATANQWEPISEVLDSQTITETGAAGLMPNESVGYSYNTHGLPVASGGTNSYETWTDYDPHGRVIRATDGTTPKQTVITNSWDEPTGRLINNSVDIQTGTSAVDYTSYTYDQAGLITSATDARDAETAATTDRQCYTYDYLQRLTNVWTDAGTTHTTTGGVGGCTTTDPTSATLSGPAPYWQTYSYDLAGNRTATATHTPSAATTSTTEAYTAAPVHALSNTTTGTTATNYSYDPDGRTTSAAVTTSGAPDTAHSSTYTWAATGQLASLTQGPPSTPTHTTSYGYDADGNLIARVDDQVATLYLGGDTLTITGGVATYVMRRYTFPGAPTVVRAERPGASAVHYNALNYQGTGITDVNATSMAVAHRGQTPFGADRWAADNASWLGDRGFVNGTRDTTTALTNLGAREYNPALGRFLSVDPVLETNDPQALNGYTYTDNNPINQSDPTGLRPLGQDGGGDTTAGCWGTGACTETHYTAPHRYAISLARARLQTASAAYTKRAKDAIYSPSTGLGGLWQAAQAGILSFAAASGGHCGEDDPSACVPGAGLAGGTGNWDDITYARENANYDREASAQLLATPEGQALTAAQNALGDAQTGLTNSEGDFAAETGAGGIGPVLKGQAGVDMSVSAAEARGETVIGREVTIDTSAGRTRIDVVVREPDGSLKFIESKNGPNAGLTPNQSSAFPVIRTSGGIPRGANAANAGLEPGVPIGPTSVQIDQWGR